MWTCSFCGGHHGMMFRDKQLTGVICLHPDCGRFNEMDEKVLSDDHDIFPETDL